MEFWTAVAVLRRRWYVFAPCLILTVVVAMLVASQSKPTYKAAGTVFLAVPASDPVNSGVATTTTLEGGPKGANPIADMDRLQVLNIMAEIAMDSNFTDQVIAAGGSRDYVVSPPFANTPSLAVYTVAATPERAMADYRVLIEVFQKEVLARQAGSPPASVLTAQEVTKPNNAYAQNGARTKGVLVVGIVGLILSIGITFLVDSVLAARRRRRDANDATGGLVSIAPLRSPLDELVELEGPDDPDTSGSLRRSADVPVIESSSRPTGRLGGVNPTRW